MPKTSRPTSSTAIDIQIRQRLDKRSPRLKMLYDIYTMLPEEYQRHIDSQVNIILADSDRVRAANLDHNYNHRIGFASAFEIVVVFNLVKDGIIRYLGNGKFERLYPK